MNVYEKYWLQQRNICENVEDLKQKQHKMEKLSKVQVT